MQRYVKNSNDANRVEKMATTSARKMIQTLIDELCLVPNKNFEEGRDRHISAYGEFDIMGRTILIRVSDHNTYLYNWVANNQKMDLKASANYAITLIDKVPFHNKPNTDNIIKAKNPPVFIVRQYVYYCNFLTADEADRVLSACIQLACTGVYSDPLSADSRKHSIVLRHETNQPTIDMTSKTRKAQRRRAKKQTSRLHPADAISGK